MCIVEIGFLKEPFASELDELQNTKTFNRANRDLGEVKELLAQYGPTLSLIANRVLGNQEDSATAVQTCLRSASDIHSHFRNKGAFASWLVRHLIDEALRIRDRKLTDSLNVAG
jgi:DNA-directed RNA polymerase specialized sigma24 family protein